ALMLELLAVFHEDVYRSVSSPWDPDDPRASVEATTKSYLELYGENHDLFGILIELAPSDAQVAEIGLHAPRRFHIRIEHALQRFHPGYGSTSTAPLASIAKTLADVWTDGVALRR